MTSALGLLALGFVLAPPAMPAQFVVPAAGRPWQGLKLNPKTRVQLSFRNASIDSIVAFFQSVTGVDFVKDPSLVGGITLTSARPVSLDDALGIFSTVLRMKGYRLEKESGLLVIRKAPPVQARTQIPITPPRNPASGMILRLYPIRYANASQLAATLNQVFTSGTTTFPTFGPQGGGPGGGPPMVNGPQGSGPGGGGPPMIGGPQFGPQENAAPMDAAATSFRASADDFSNAVVLNATERVHTEVKALIDQLDRPTGSPNQVEVYRLTYASADDTVTVIQNLLTANAPRGRGGATASTNTNAFPMMFLPPTNSTSGTGQAVADSRTNSIVVTATDANQKVVREIVRDLDREIKVESTAFVFPLKNAKAADIASLLQQTFGSRSGTGSTTTNSNSNSSSGTNRSNQPSGGPPSLGGLDIPLSNPDADSGDLLTRVGIAQGFGIPLGQPSIQTPPSGNSSSSNAANQVRGADGRIVNTQNLSNQVTAIADPNTNSILIVTSPENAQVVRDILDRLDKIPEQVMIEAIIVEASLNSTQKLGVEWSLSHGTAIGGSKGTGKGVTDFGLSAASAVPGFQYTVTAKNLSGLLTALSTDTRYQVLSTPRIFTSNNVEAEINVSQSVPYVLSSQQDSNGNFSYNYSFLDVGVVLTVTPHITSNGYVTMEVDQTANDLQGYTDFNAPIVNQREANTTVSVRDGETIVLGGIIRSTVTSTVKKIPFVGDLPLLGNLFRSTSKEKQKTELLVFLRPRIVRNAEDAARLTQESGPLVAPKKKNR